MDRGRRPTFLRDNRPLVERIVRISDSVKGLLSITGHKLRNMLRLMIPAFQSLPTKTDRRPTPPQIPAIAQVSGSLPRFLHLYHTEAEEHRQRSFGYEQNGAHEIEANAIK
jgi:hypothetical protein